MEAETTPRAPGSYLGTEKDGRWWKRYRARGFFARGKGELWLEDGAICFRRLLTRTPLRIPFERITGVILGRWHSGRWMIRERAIKVQWRADGEQLSSGFVLGRTEEHAREAASRLRERIGLESERHRP